MGADLASVFSGIDLQLQNAEPVHDHAVRRARQIGLVIGILLLVSMLGVILWSWLIAMFAIPTLITAWVALYAGLMIINRRMFLRKVTPGRENAPQRHLNDQLLSFRTQSVHPFLQRNRQLTNQGESVAPEDQVMSFKALVRIGQESEIVVTEKELHLLIDLLEREHPGIGRPVPHEEDQADAWHIFLTANALAHDLGVVDLALRNTDSDGTLEDAYAQWVQPEQDDVYMPFLLELLKTEDQSPDPHLVAERVAERRKHHELKSFAGDLERRRSGGGLQITMQMIDLMDPTTLSS